MRREEKKQQKKKSILQAAVTIFSRDGFEKARVSDIAQLAGVGHGTVYLYFPTKGDLLDAIYNELMVEALDELRREVARGQDASEKLSVLFQTQLDMMEKNPDITKLLLVDMRFSEEYLSSSAVRMTLEYIGLVEGILREGIESGHFQKGIHPETTATFIYGGFDAVITRWILERPSIPLRQQLETLTGMLLDCLRHS